MMGRGKAAFVVLGLLVGLAGCGVGAQANADRVSAAQVPFGLLSPAGISSEPTPRRTTETVVLFLLHGRHLVAVTRELPAPVSFDARLGALVSGPTTREAAAGLTSAVSGQGTALAGSVHGSVATVSLPPAFEQLDTQDQISALAQLVYTATALPAVQSVRFDVDGVRVGVPRADDTTTTGPVGRADYRALAS